MYRINGTYQPPCTNHCTLLYKERELPVDDAHCNDTKFSQDFFDFQFSSVEQILKLSIMYSNLNNFLSLYPIFTVVKNRLELGVSSFDWFSKKFPHALKFHIQKICDHFCHKKSILSESIPTTFNNLPLGGGWMHMGGGWMHTSTWCPLDALQPAG